MTAPVKRYDGIQGKTLAEMYDKLASDYERMRRAGQLLSNAAFNLAQRQELDESTRAKLRDLYKGWDAALQPKQEETTNAN